MSMQRRELLTAGTLGLLALGAKSAMAKPAEGKKPTTPSLAPTPTPAPDPKKALLDALAKCISAGEVCQAHCVEELGKGNVSMANCNRRVHEMLAMCRATQTLAALESTLLAQAAATCAAACKACAEACGEHKAHFAHGMHQACKDCMESCQACEKACSAVK